MKWLRYLTLALSLGMAHMAKSQVFTIEQPDFTKSPFTGMTREHWKQAARYMLEGAFSYIHQISDPLVFPKQPGVSYPTRPAQYPVEKLEGLCRTLFIATPLLKEDSNIVVNNIRLIDYYRYHLQKITDSLSDSYISPRAPDGGPHQNLVEFGALSICFFSAPDILWQPLSPALKERLAHTMLSYGDGPTNASNWRFFNVFVLSFFQSQGYAVNNTLLEQYLRQSLTHYRGAGWYSDVPAYDYYSMWAFQFYGLLWTEFFGQKHYPEIAAQLRSHFRDMEANYPYNFARNGDMIMWGRSITYRFGAVGPLAFTGFLEEGPKNPGWYRRIASGSLLQFLQHPQFLNDRVPTLGFYGAFEPAVQYYSCRGSVYWMGKAFLALLLPADNPFWTATENEGPWASAYSRSRVYNRFHPGSNILVSNYPAIGGTELRAWCHTVVNGNWTDYRANENYNRLAYHSAFPWQADGPNGEVAMNYVAASDNKEWEPLHLYEFRGFKDSIYYRRARLETDSTAIFDLADIPLPNGVLRVDRYDGRASTLHLGHYALPQLKGPIRQLTRRVGKYQATIIDNGEYQLAMISLHGWSAPAAVNCTGLHPAAEKSTLLMSSATTSSSLLISLQLWKKSGEAWTDEELVPVSILPTMSDRNSVIVRFRDGSSKTVFYP